RLRAGGRRLRAPAGRGARGSAGADPQRRLALGRLQALLHADRAGRRARRRGHAARGPLVRRRPLLTRRRASYRSIASLQRDNRVCRACAEEGYPLESLSIVQPYEGQLAYMFGQAPGVVEGEERRPWRGRAGRPLRRWVAIPLPHPSGASGWLNDPANRERVAEAAALIRAELVVVRSKGPGR